MFNVLKSEAVKFFFAAELMLIAFFASQIYTTMQEIQRQFIQMDKRVTSIEISRSERMPEFIKMLGEVADLKQSLELSQEKIAVIQSCLNRNKIF